MPKRCGIHTPRLEHRLAGFVRSLVRFTTFPPASTAAVPHTSCSSCSYGKNIHITTHMYVHTVSFIQNQLSAVSQLFTNHDACIQVWMADPATQAAPLAPPRHHMHPCSFDGLHPSLQEDADANIGPLADVREALLGPEASKVRSYSVHPHEEALLFSKLPVAMYSTVGALHILAVEHNFWYC